MVGDCRFAKIHRSSRHAYRCCAGGWTLTRRGCACALRAARGAAAERINATRNGFPFRRFETQKVWKAVTDTPRLLSLSTQSYEYTGGAHAYSATATLVWDKASRQRLAPIALFAAPAALERRSAPAIAGD
ncbi:DUF4163 domain-containing protein [Sphingomonas sp. MA1305]|uniref:DUF4163 domain-containing protein n=1 Tax=Sphingomonas sp. MA1305 TaxID=2479204 RepID=UPI0018DFEF5E|nr:DUF4163 domain-containing protein [Sphingomonas sp. MA1305]MBI0474091.1 DUF4163 domain-containing protein [Sphingomonas sp. MA1305]